jgi:hypothetical protein
VSEKSIRKAPDYAVESRAAGNCSVFRPEFQLCPCHTAEERYNPCEPGPKKEIQVKDSFTIEPMLALTSSYSGETL